MLGSFAVQDSPHKIDYKIYQWKKTEFIIVLGKGILVAALLSYFFYKSILAMPAMCVPGWLFIKYQKRKQEENRRRVLIVQFKECILSVVASLRAGYAVENAFLESFSDMERIYGKDAMICRELDYIRRGMVVNITLEELLRDFGQRSSVEEIIEFAEVFSIAKRRGGNISDIIRASAELISQKIMAEEEIHILLAAKKLEQSVMNFMPFGILLYIGIGNKGYFDSLYHNFSGIAIMTACLVIYLTAFYLAEKILNQTAEKGTKTGGE
ncbi:type II secretion system protein F [Lachnospiraceae bacterium OttesenSCG-928-D06]|nr:type II secretion system protein F [Lachnospiraceae bacterium OttesenSCG-928-D06]